MELAAILVVLVAAPADAQRYDAMRRDVFVRGRLPLAYKILALQVCIVVAAAVAGVLTAGWQARQELDRMYEQRSLSVAESVANMPTVKSALLEGDPSHTIQATAEAVRHATGASYVVVTDRRGTRFSHPNQALIV